MGNLRRLEAHEAFIDVIVNACEVRWWGAKGGESRSARVDDPRWGLDSYSAMSDHGNQRVSFRWRLHAQCCREGKLGEGRQSKSEDEEVAEVPKTKTDVILLDVGGQFKSRVVLILAGQVPSCG